MPKTSPSVTSVLAALAVAQGTPDRVAETLHNLRPTERVVRKILRRLAQSHADNLALFVRDYAATVGMVIDPTRTPRRPQEGDTRRYRVLPGGSGGYLRLPLLAAYGFTPGAIAEVTFRADGIFVAAKHDVTS